MGLLTMMRSGLLAAVIVIAAGCGASTDIAVEPTSTNVPTSSDPVPVDEADPNEAGEPDIIDNGDAATALAAARQRWIDADLGDHTLVVEDDCIECGPGERAIGEVVVWGEDRYASGPALTVESVFDRIDAAIADGRPVTASYDVDTGYPSDVVIDGARDDVDGGSRLRIHEIRPGLPGTAFSSDSFTAAARRWQATRPHAYEYVVTVACGGCDFEGRLWVRVVGDNVVDEEFRSSGGDVTASGITVDQLFTDLGDLLASDGGIIESGVLINGTAAYDPEFGYPNWIGLDLEVVEPDEWSQGLPPRLVYMIGRFEPLESDEYCAAVDGLLSSVPGARPDEQYLRRLQWVQGLAPPEHAALWDLLHTLADEPFDYAIFNPAADELDATAASLTEICPTLDFFAMNDDGYVTYLR